MSRLSEILEAGKFSVTAELGPPMSADAEHVRERARTLRGVVDAVNITDNQTSIVRMSSIAAGAIALSEGVEPVVQMTCRDRNRIAIQSDLLGAYALGMRNLLCLSGDHQCFGNHPQAKNVYDIDSIQLVQAVEKLRTEGQFISGKPCKMPPEYYIGATINPFADPEELQLIRLRKKISAGAKFIQTQAIYDVENFSHWMEKVRELKLHKNTHILAGVMVNKSFRSIEMTAKVAGMKIPEKYIERMRNAADAQAEGMEISLEIIKEIKSIEGVDGIHIMAVGWEAIVPVIVERAGFLPRPRLVERE